MSAAFTPGPWHLEQTACLSVVADGHLGALAELRSRLDYGGMHPAVAETREANARLIAAAPELLEALRDMLDGWKYIRQSHGDLYGVGWDRAQDKAETAIAKATGETK